MFNYNHFRFICSTLHVNGKSFNEYVGKLYAKVGVGNSVTYDFLFHCLWDTITEGKEDLFDSKYVTVLNYWNKMSRCVCESKINIHEIRILNIIAAASNTDVQAFFEDGEGWYSLNDVIKNALGEQNKSLYGMIDYSNIPNIISLADNLMEQF